MLNVLHTADVHLDTPFSGSRLTRDQAMERRLDLLSTFRKTGQLCQEHGVDIVLIPGDLFEEQFVTIATMQRLLRTLADLAPIPVVIAPGNHDPYHSGSPWAVEELPENLFLFRDRTISSFFFEALNTRVWGTAFTAYHQEDRRWQGFKADSASEGEIQLLCTHGAFTGREDGQAAKYLPITEDDLSGSGVAYAALGHYHRSFDVWKDRFTDSVRAAYSGSPEPVRFGPEQEHGMIIASIDDAQNTCRLQRVPTQQRSMRRIVCNVDGARSITDIDQAVTDIVTDPALEKAIVELRLTGTVAPEVTIIPDELRELGPALFSIDIIDATRRDFDVDAIAAEETIRGAYVRSILKKLEAARDDTLTEDVVMALEDALQLGLSAFEGQTVKDLPL